MEKKLNKKSNHYKYKELFIISSALLAVLYLVYMIFEVNVTEKYHQFGYMAEYGNTHFNFLLVFISRLFELLPFVLLMSYFIVYKKDKPSVLFPLTLIAFTFSNVFVGLSLIEDKHYFIPLSIAVAVLLFVVAVFSITGFHSNVFVPSVATFGIIIYIYRALRTFEVKASELSVAEEFTRAYDPAKTAKVINPFYARYLTGIFTGLIFMIIILVFSLLNDIPAFENIRDSKMSPEKELELLDDSLAKGDITPAEFRKRKAEIQSRIKE